MGDQAGLYMLSLETGDIISGLNGQKPFYEISESMPESANEKLNAPEPKYGYFKNDCVVGLLHDADRGMLTFFKDGNSLGIAYNTKYLT